MISSDHINLTQFQPYQADQTPATERTVELILLGYALTTSATPIRNMTEHMTFPASGAVRTPLL